MSHGHVSHARLLCYATEYGPSTLGSLSQASAKPVHVSAKRSVFYSSNKYKCNNSLRMYSCRLHAYYTTGRHHHDSATAFCPASSSSSDTARTFWSMKLNSASPAAHTSSSITDSSGEWLMPPRHRTNSIPICDHTHTPERQRAELSFTLQHTSHQPIIRRLLTLVSLAIAIASCPAPLISTGVSLAAATVRPGIADTVDRAARFSWDVSSGSQGVAAAECWCQTIPRSDSIRHHKIYTGTVMTRRMLTHLMLDFAIDQSVVAFLENQPREARDDRLPHLVVHRADVHREVHLLRARLQGSAD